MAKEKYLSNNAKERKNLFNTMTKKHRVIEVAKDVLYLIKAKKVNVLSGSWLCIFHSATCEACAIGACFLSIVNKINKLDIGNSEKEFSLREIYCHLIKVFSKQQIILIENSFECGSGGLRINGYNGKLKFNQLVIGRGVYNELKDTKISYDLLNKAISFGRNYQKSEDRLVAIMKNIIKNNGVFKP